MIHVSDELDGYSAVVTGGAQGIGKAIALRLSQAGMHVVILDRDRKAGAEAHADIERSVFIAGDASREADVKAAVRRAQALGRGLRAAIANAGVQEGKPFLRQGLAAWKRTLDTNLTGAFLLARHAAPALKRARGAILLIASTRAFMSEPGWEAYSATKGGLVGMSGALCQSLGPEVRVNCISPGWVPTDNWQRTDRKRPPHLSRADHAQHPVGRAGRPEDIASLAHFLLSAQAGFITGAHFIADGGMTRKMNYV